MILSMHSDEGYVLRALKAGAKGYLLKDSAEGDLIDAIKSVHEGKTFFSPEITQMLMEDYVREIRTRGRGGQLRPADLARDGKSCSCWRS